jgi:hypothetical protein
MNLCFAVLIPYSSLCSFIQYSMFLQICEETRMALQLDVHYFSLYLFKIHITKMMQLKVVDVNEL